MNSRCLRICDFISTNERRCASTTARMALSCATRSALSEVNSATFFRSVSMSLTTCYAFASGVVRFSFALVTSSVARSYFYGNRSVFFCSASRSSAVLYIFVMA